MISSNVDQLMRRTFLYSYILSQPFTVYVDAYPIIENKILLESKPLQYGEHSEAVRILQKKLQKLELYNDEVDGHYGIITEYALKKFQAEYGITVTGQANEETIKLVLKEEINKQLEILDTLPDQINISSKNEHIELVQGVLSYFGYYTGEIDGIYGPLTEQAIEIAEKEHDLNVSGKFMTKKEIEKMLNDEKEEIKQTKMIENDQSMKVKVVNQTENIIQRAKSLIGSPYRWGGSSPQGFDCSGFIQYLYKEERKTIPRTVSDIWNFSTPIGSPAIGDLVFFETYKAGPSHLGIYIGNDQFIHAGMSNGVEISNLKDNYWRNRYLGAKRVQ